MVPLAYLLARMEIGLALFFLRQPPFLLAYSFLMQKITFGATQCPIKCTHTVLFLMTYISGPRTVFYASALYYGLICRGVHEAVAYLLLFTLRVAVGMIVSPEPFFALVERILQLFFGVEEEYALRACIFSPPQETPVCFSTSQNPRSQKGNSWKEEEAAIKVLFFFIFGVAVIYMKSKKSSNSPAL